MIRYNEKMISSRHFEKYKNMIWVDRKMQKDIRNSGKIVLRKGGSDRDDFMGKNVSFESSKLIKQPIWRATAFSFSQNEAEIKGITARGLRTGPDHRQPQKTMKNITFAEQKSHKIPLPLLTFLYCNSKNVPFTVAAIGKAGIFTVALARSTFE